MTKHSAVVFEHTVRRDNLMYIGHDFINSGADPEELHALCLHEAFVDNIAVAIVFGG